MEVCKIVVFTPLSHAEKIRDVLAASGTGHIGNYDACSFSSRGIGRFRPLKGAHPAVGTQDMLEEVEEEKIEVFCPVDILQQVLMNIREVHPYEEPAIDVYKLFLEI